MAFVAIGSRIGPLVGSIIDPNDAGQAADVELAAALARGTLFVAVNCQPFKLAFMASVSIHHFLELLEQSKLLDDGQLALARSLICGESCPETFSRILVYRRFLTRWQARVLLAGKKGPFFLGNYRLLQPLGKGARGSVFKANHSAMKRIVALKVMSRGLLTDQRALTRFKREIRAAASLDHPHIIHALDAGHVKNTYFLVMEYATGQDLSHWIAAGGQSLATWSCECIRQAALGLQYAHERGIVHRDIKPSNLLLTQTSIGERPLLKIADFGLARFGFEAEDNQGLTRIGQALGTSDYIAPEQAQDSTQSDIRADIFSLGCTLFELLSGQLPFKGASPFERLMARFREEPPLVSSVRCDVPPDLDQIVARMLSRDPTARFQSPGEVAEALRPLSWKEPEIDDRSQFKASV